MSSTLHKILNQAVGPAADDQNELDLRIQEAKNLIHQYVRPSPLRRSEWLSDLIGADVWLKLECLNPKGSFKLRGALNAIAKRLHEFKKVNPQGKMKVCAASAGNHAQGVGLAAKMLGCEAHIFLPTRAPLVKRVATEKLGAKVYIKGNNLEEASEAAIEFAKENGAEFIHAYNDIDIICGQATCALEALEQFSEQTDGKLISPVDFVMGIGGGGLAAGISYVMRRKASGSTVGVEQEFFDSAARSLKEKSQQGATLAGKATIADGVAVKRIGNLNYDFLSRYMDEVLLVSDDDIVAAVLGLCENEHIVTEGAGGLAIAAVMKNAKQFAKKSVIVCVSGGNIDPQLLGRVLARGLGVTGRLLRLNAEIGDYPGCLRNLLDEVARLDGNILEVHHDRTYSKVNVGNVEVELSLETKNIEHQKQILKRLEEVGIRYRVAESSFG